MRVILEGACGVGKTSLARALSALSNTPVYRPFRGKSEHITQSTVTAMQDLGLSVNGWEEDMYTADFLSVVRSDVIIDRSMPSAMAYNEVSSSPLAARARQTILRLWAERIAAARATIVLVVCAEATRKQRCPDRGGEWEARGILNATSEAAHVGPTPGFSVWRVNTNKASPEALAQVINRRVMVGATSMFIETLADPNRPRWFNEQ